MYYVYILQSEIDNNFYTGYTGNLSRRFKEHQTGKVKSTEERRPLNLVYYESCLHKWDAKHREKYLKTSWGNRYIKNRMKYYLKNSDSV